MADPYSHKNRAANSRVDPSYDVYDEDPLVELARIVSEDGGYFNISNNQQEAPAPEPGMGIGAAPDEPDIGLDLEAQLLEELEMSMAAPEDAMYADDYREETYLPQSGEPAAEHNYAPEDSAALAQMSELPADTAIENASLSMEPDLGEWTEEWSEQPEAPVAGDMPEAAYGASEFDVDPLAEGHTDEILTSEELSGLGASLSHSEDYFTAEQVDLESEFSGAVTQIKGRIDDDALIGIPPVTPVEAGFSAGERDAAPQASRSGRKLFAIAAVLSIAVLGGGVVAMMSSTSMTQPSGAPPVIKASNEPVKSEPDAGSDVAENDSGQSVFDVAANSGEPVEEVLRDRTEKPVDRIIPLEDTAQTDVLRPVGEEEKSLARISAGESGSASAPKFDPIGPKRVTTVKVGPDGTIIRPTLDENKVAAKDTSDTMIVGGLPSAVPADDSAAATDVVEPEPVPVDTVEIRSGSETTDQAVSETSTETSPLTSVIAGLPEGEAESGAVPLPRGRPEGAPTVVASTTPAVDPTPLVAKPAQPTQNNGSGPVNLLEAAKLSAPRRVAPASTGSTASAGGGSGYLVQLSSQRSEEQARAAFNGLKRRYPSLLGGFEPNIQRADLGDRGIYYRVRVGPMSDQAGATQVCEQLKSSGGSCFVTR